MSSTARRGLYAATLFATVATAVAQAPASRSRSPVAPTLGEPRVAPLVEGVASFGAATLADAVYVVGGHVGPTHVHAKANLTGALRRLKLAPDAAWETLATDAALQGLAVVAHRGALLRVGGLAARNEDPEHEDLVSVADVVRYDPTTDAWTPFATLPAGRSSHDACVVGDRLYVVGGWSLDGAARAWPAAALVLDLANPGAGWTEIPQPFRRRALAVATDGVRLYAMGGLDEHGKTSRRTDVLDLAAGAWSAGPDIPSDGFGCAATQVGGAVLLLTADGALRRLATDGSAWRDAGALAQGRVFAELVATGGGRVLALGGARKSGRARVVESFDLAAKADACRATAVVSLPYAGRARNRQASFVDGDRLHLVGGNVTTEQHDFRPEAFSDEHVVVDLATLGSAVVGRAPAARQSMVVVADPTRPRAALLAGGFGHDGASARTQSEIWRLDADAHPADAALTKAPLTLPVPLTQFGFAAEGPALFVLGGLDYDAGRAEDDAFRHFSRALRAPASEAGASFAEVAGGALAGPRRAFGCARLGDVVYVVGGMREGFSPVAGCEGFDVRTRRSATVRSPRRVRISPELVALGGRLYLCGGSSDRGEGLKPDPSIEAYDPAKDTWTVATETAPLVGPHLRAEAYGARLLLWSTHDAEGRFSAAFVDVGGGMGAASRNSPHGG